MGRNVWMCEREREKKRERRAKERERESEGKPELEKATQVFVFMSGVKKGHALYYFMPVLGCSNSFFFFIIVTRHSGIAGIAEREKSNPMCFWLYGIKNTMTGVNRSRREQFEIQ